jgi:hypothetical protein
MNIQKPIFNKLNVSFALFNEPLRDNINPYVTNRYRIIFNELFRKMYIQTHLTIKQNILNEYPNADI